MKGVPQWFKSRFELQRHDLQGPEWERFCVEDKCFQYSDSDTGAGFNNTSSHGGPIKSGLHVRVTFVANTIVKLEVAQ